MQNIIRTCANLKISASPNRANKIAVLIHDSRPDRSNRVALSKTVARYHASSRLPLGFRGAQGYRQVNINAFPRFRADMEVDSSSFTSTASRQWTTWVSSMASRRGSRPSKMQTLK